MRVVNIVQARMESTRLPGKSLALLRGLPIIDWVAERTTASGSTDEVVFAVPAAASSDPLATHLEREGRRVVRGPDEDVLGRYLLAARATDADVVIRTCADRPLVSGEIIDLTVSEHLAQARGGLTFSHRPWRGASWDYGFGVEVMGRDLLEELGSRAYESSHREHVTLLLYEQLVSTVRPATVPQHLSSLMVGGRRFDVDEASDLERLQPLLDGLGTDATVEEVLTRAQPSCP